LSIQKILLIISGGIAAYKSIELIRIFKADGLKVRCVATKSALNFVTTATIEYLSGEVLRTSLHDREQELKMSHIELARWPDVVLVAPATANIIAASALGLAGDLAQTILLATTKPIFLAPSMNVQMWENKTVQKNVSSLVENNIQIIGPEKGEMACGEFGYGRMTEPLDIYNFLKKKNLAY
jgi:phosphopantothenoylcysteine decarboxylase/phosphopantothenate--cysteine ligase